MKIGFIIPLFTSELESSVYISYISWFLSGIFVNMIRSKLAEDARRLSRGLHTISTSGLSVLAGVLSNSDNTLTGTS